PMGLHCSARRRFCCWGDWGLNVVGRQKALHRDERIGHETPRCRPSLNEVQRPKALPGAGAHWLALQLLGGPE
ncbi:hypothetical protein ACFU44_17495, partial [Nocardia rhizosphaerihabitans]|uniref:hypothetical protein n=1 Tax=Nocardia rhizosphaerihabitans TaxID=1691570 RepID=UPI00366CFE15